MITDRSSLVPRIVVFAPISRFRLDVRLKACVRYVPGPSKRRVHPPSASHSETAARIGSVHSVTPSARHLTLSSGHVGSRTV